MSLPPSPFLSAESQPSAETAPASNDWNPEDAGATDHIGEIFVGALKLEPVEMWFENTAYPREDELLFEVLSAVDDPATSDLREIPYGMHDIFDPMPLFLRRA